MRNFTTKIAVLLLGLSAGCKETVTTSPPPLAQGEVNRFAFPTGMGLTHLTDGRAALLVVSSNFDLRYDPALGGSLIAIDPDLALGQGRNQASIVPLGGTGGTRGTGVRIGSMGSELAVVDSASCPGYSGPPVALVPSRSQRQLFLASINPDTGALGCGAGAGTTCPGIPLDASPADPWDVTAVCNGTSITAYVTYLRAPGGHGWVSRVALDVPNGFDKRTVDSPPGRDLTATTFTRPGSTGAQVNAIPASPTGNLAYDADLQRLYVSSRFFQLNFAPLYWIDLAALAPDGLGDDGRCPTVFGASACSNVGVLDLTKVIRGADMRGIALSTPGTGFSRRAYLVVDVYDADTAASSGAVVTTGSALAVLDLTETAAGPSLGLVRFAPLCLGASELRVLPPRAGKRDLVAVTCIDDGMLAIYDDEAGGVAATIGLWQSEQNGAGAHLGIAGTPILGRQPFGIAVERADGRCLGPAFRPNPAPPPPASCDRIYVGSFAQGVVSVVELDPASPQSAYFVGSIGEAMP